MNASTLASRRWFLQQCGVGLGAIAAHTLLADRAWASPGDPLAPKPPHYPARAKNVIFLFMAGGPSHLELFDYKPQLAKFSGTLPPPDLIKGYRAAFINPNSKLLGPKFAFSRHGACGAELSELLPHLATVADEIAIVKSMVTDAFNHAPAQIMMNTGSPQFGRPSMGAWVTYGLGSENENLPGFVVLISSGTQPSAGKLNWGSGFLPSVYQGVQCRSVGDPVLYVSDPPGLDRDLRRKSLDALRDLNELQAAELGHPETATRIAQYEMAFRMQAAVPEVMDISKEPESVLGEYGAKPGAGSFANNCLLARRLVEKGVRFVQLFDWGWDFHGTNAGEALGEGLLRKCATMDRPVAALLRDLKARGLLDETLVVWGGEFGRTPFREGRTSKSTLLGRDHYPDCFSIFLAGGGVKRGIVYGETDELGFQVVRDKVHVHDLQATILHLLGLDHEKLTFRFQGRDFRLTDVHGRVVQGLLA
ncbi:MAG: DUF1501 domain-containing protein [Planctomycetota bacterium]